MRQSFKKAVLVLRDHTPAQIRNIARYCWSAWRGFPTVEVAHEPVWLDLLITARCNLRCLHCSVLPWQHRQPKPFGDMKLDSFRRILDRFPSATSIVLAGGEPLLHPSVFDMIQEAGSRRLKVHLPTNGTLLPRLRGQVLDSPIHMLNVSLYGADAGDFNAVTGGGKFLFDEVVRGMEQIAKLRSPGGYPRVLRASYICTRANFERVEDFIRHCEEIGVDQVKLKNLNPVGAVGFGADMCLRADDQDVQRFLRRLQGHRFRIPVFPPRLYQIEYRRRGCTMPFRSLTIDGDGHIGPCCMRGTAPVFGNLFADSGIWNGATMKRARQVLLNVSAPLPSWCSDCEEMIPDRRSL